MVRVWSRLAQTVKQMWPFICQFVDKLFRESIEPAVQGANPHLSSFCFSKIDMGDKVGAHAARKHAIGRRVSSTACLFCSH